MPDAASSAPRWGFIGAGKMATALIRGMLRAGGSGAPTIVASDPVEAARVALADETGIPVYDSNARVAHKSDVLVLATKPQSLPHVLAHLRPVLTPEHLVISIAAGVSLATLAEGLGPERRLARVMPNTPALVGEGAAGYCLGPHARDSDEPLVLACLEAVGRAYRVPESMLDAVTGLSGSGPAFVYVIIEALSDGGVRVGLPRDVATALAAQTVLGAARMVLETGLHTGVLKDHVTSPGGMFQSYALFPHMSVEKNIAFGLKQDGLPKDEISVRVGEMLRLVQLERLAKRYPSQLSGGQRQRVALARALAKKPKVLLLDEPLGALDKKLREETQFELMDIQHELGMTFVVVTHDQEEAMTMADRIAVMDHGRIVQVATPGEIYEQPKTRFIAEFVGDVNILEGNVFGQKNGLWHVQTPSAEAPLTIDDPDEVLHSGQAVAIAVRPEKMVIQRNPPDPGAVNVLTGEVWDIGYLGDWTVYRVKLASGAILRVTLANRSRFVESPIDWDDQVYVTFAPDAAVILAE